jgi:hypothetical protein
LAVDVFDSAVDQAHRALTPFGFDPAAKSAKPPRQIDGGKFMFAGVGFGIAFVHFATHLAVAATPLDKDVP